MINLTDQPIFLCEGEELDRKIRSAITKLYNAIDVAFQTGHWKREQRRLEDAYGNTEDKAFFVLFAHDCLTSNLLDGEFVRLILEYANLPNKAGAGEVFGRLSVYFNRKVSWSAYLIQGMQSLFRMLFVYFWAEKAVLLPFIERCRAPNRNVGNGTFFGVVETEVSKFFASYSDGIAHRPAGAIALAASSPLTISRYGPRLIWSTTYHSVEDIVLSEVAELHRALILSANGQYEFKLSVTYPPLLAMMRELQICFPDRVPFSKREIDDYTGWVGRTHSLGKSDAIDPIQKDGEGKAKLSGGKSKTFKRLSEVNDHEAILRYFSTLKGVQRKGVEWLLYGAPYTGREHVDLKGMAGKWHFAFSEWLNYRRNIQRFETDAPVIASFSILCDYLFLYLPWWKELNPDSLIDVPTSPNAFKRAIFVHRTLTTSAQGNQTSSLPKTFLEILPLRRPGVDSQYSAILTLTQFFEWIEIGFDEDPLIGGPGFRSPFKRLDLPRLKKRSKSNKVPFSKRTYPHLLYYCYAVEAFGEYIQKLALERPDVFGVTQGRFDKFWSTGPTPEQVSDKGQVSVDYLDDNPESFGYVPYISYRGKNYPIYRIPNVFHWARRTVDMSRFGVEGGVVERWIPHLSSMRMLTGGVETGLRMQSLQWLDARYWDLLNRRNGVSPDYSYSSQAESNDRFALPMLISTDKVKQEPWSLLVVYRVRNCFYREQYFRESILETGINDEDWYEGTVDSRFGKISPLFRSSNSPEPVSDSLYSKNWKHLIWGFEEYFNESVSDAGEFVQFVYLAGTAEEAVPDYIDTDVDKILAISTPHACRVTYATNRTGILEASDVAQQLGHENTVTTAHYTLSTLEIMEEKLAAVEREIQSGFGASYIRADNPQGALCKGFQEDRAKTIDSFQFAPPIAFWKTEDLDGGQDGVEFLRSSPMSQIRFRETHICPVGESCPTDVLEKIGEHKRCGLCPLAMRCVDHLPAIAAKVNQLKMKVRTDVKRAERLAAAGEPDSSVDALYEAAELDANELVGWQFSHDILLKMLESRPNGGSAEYHVQAPEIVKKHLQAVTADRSISQFFLQRIADAKAYPTMADPEIQRIADRYCRYILAGNYQVGIDDDPIAALAGLVKTHMEPLGLTMVDLAAKIDQFEAMNSAGSQLLLERKQFMLADTQEAEE